MSVTLSRYPLISCVVIRTVKEGTFSKQNTDNNQCMFCSKQRSIGSCVRYILFYHCLCSCWGYSSSLSMQSVGKKMRRTSPNQTRVATRIFFLLGTFFSFSVWTGGQKFSTTGKRIVMNPQYNKLKCFGWSFTLITPDCYKWTCYEILYSLIDSTSLFFADIIKKTNLFYFKLQCFAYNKT